MRYTFQQSKIWEGGYNPVDERMPKVTVKVKPGPDGECRARRKLPAAGMGRVWILVQSNCS